MGGISGLFYRWKILVKMTLCCFSIINTTTKHDQDDVLHQNSSIKIRICGTFWVANNPIFLWFLITPNLTKMSEIYSELLNLIWTLKKKLRTPNIFSAHEIFFGTIKKNNTNSKLVSNFFPNVIKNKPGTPPIAFASDITPDGQRWCVFCSAPLNFGKIN